MKRAALLTALLTLVPLTDATGGSRAPAPPRQPLSIADITAASNAFALDLYHQLATEEGNLFFSPSSLVTALGMMGTGARGKTAAEVAELCHWPEDLRRVHPKLHDLADALVPRYPNHVIWRSVNRLWGQEGFNLLPEFLADVQRWYQGGYATVDYLRDTEGARREINRWVAKNTANRIRDLLPPGAVDAKTRLVLTNAVYFLATWAKPFSKEMTHEQPFHLADGRQRPVPLMLNTAEFPYTELVTHGERLQIVELPYAGDDYGMVVILPASPTGLPDLERRLDAKTLAGWLAGLTPHQVRCLLPRLKLSDRFFLRDTLRAMGLRTAFTDRADFSGITGRRDMFVQAFIHKAFLKVDEKGTEAAAATLFTYGITSVENPVNPVEFRADHPFLLLIRHRPTGAIQFLGRVTDPGA